VDELLEVTAVVGLFILRLGAPLAITLAVGYWLRRLDAKWEAESLARQAADSSVEEVATESVRELFEKPEQPCWIVKNCPASARERCPVSHHPAIPCWMARLRVEGRLTTNCYGCELFAPMRVVQSRT
jgi:hypothetical protein